MITIKTVSDIDIMSIACTIVAETLDLISQNLREGITTLELNDIAHSYIVSKNAVPSFNGYNGFPKSICVSINDELIHGIPRDRIIKNGDVISVDVGAFYAGYHGDAARTFIVGEGSEKNVKLLATAKQSFFEAIKYAKVGFRLHDISHAIQRCTENNGFVVVREYCGHGIGRDLHEEPAVPNYGAPNTGMRLTEGMTLAIEPMVLIGNNDIILANDNWTVLSKNGLPTAHYENTVLITSSEPVIMTNTKIA